MRKRVKHNFRYFWRCFINRLICLRYPFIKVDSYVYPWMKGYGQTWLDELEPGWRKRFGWKLCEDVRKQLHRLPKDKRKEYHIGQVKEKWGSLEWYDNYFSLTGTYDMAMNVIRKYAELSRNTCVICGKQSTHKSVRYILPYCDDCHTKGDVCHYDVTYTGKNKK